MFPCSKHTPATLPLLAGFLLLGGGPAQAAPQLVGEFEVDGNIHTAPAVGRDGTVYFATDAGELVAMQPDGSLRWKVMAGAPSQTSPAVGEDGTIYFGAEGKGFRALNPDGSQRWSLGLSVQAAPAFGTNGFVYVTTTTGPIHALTNGVSRWQVEVGGTFRCSPVIATDGTIFAGGNQRRLVALDPNGTLRWQKSFADPVTGLALGTNSTVVLSSGRRLISVSPAGPTQWEYDTGSGALTGLPVIGADGTIYVPSNRRYLFAVNPNGTRKWQFELSAEAFNTPVLTADGTIYLGTSDGVFYGISETGQERWRHEFGTSLSSSSPALTPEGRLYFGGNLRRLRRFDMQSPPADSPWPMQGRDAARTGNAASTPGLRVSLLAPATGGRSLLGETLNLEATVSSPGVPVTNVVFLDGTNTLASLSGPPYRFQWANAAFGFHEIRAVAFAANGKSQASSVAIHFVDTRLAVSLVAPVHLTDVLLPAVVELRADATDSDAPVTGVGFFANGSSVGQTTGSPAVVTWTNPPVGAQVLTAVATNALGNVRTSAPVTINVFAEGALVARADSFTLPEDHALDVPAPGLLSNDINNHTNRAEAVLVTPPAVGSLTLSTNGAFRFLPPTNFFGNAGFGYRLVSAGRTSAVVQVELVVQAVNDPPVAQNRTFAGVEDESLGIPLTAADPDGDTLTVEVLSPPTRGWLNLPGPAAPLTLGYQPFADISGEDSFTYRLSDGTTHSEPATVTLTIAPVSEPPLARPDVYPAPTATTLVVTAADGVLSNDHDPDGFALTASLVTPATHGTVELTVDGAFSYTAAGFQGTDSFQYRITNARGSNSVATVSLRVGDSQWSGNFQAMPTESTLLTVLPRTGGGHFVGGQFMAPWPASAVRPSGVARWEGDAWLPLGNPTFHGPAGNVNALAEWNGELIVAGQFTEAGGRPALNIARWDGHQWHPLGLGVNGPVFTLAASGTNLFVGGDFTAAGGLVTTNLARWNGSSWTAMPGAPDLRVFSLLVTTENEVVVAGDDFRALGGTEQGHHVARWKEGTWTELGNSLDGSVMVLKTYEGDLIAAGRFSQIGDITTANIARWRDGQWVALQEGVGTAGSQVHSLVVQDGVLWAGEGYLGLATNVPVAVHRLESGVWTTVPSLVRGEYKANVCPLAMRGTELVARAWAEFNGRPMTNALARWNGTNWLGFGHSIGGNEIHALLQQDDGMVIAGNFKSAGDLPTFNVARWNGTNWNSLGNGSPDAMDGPALALAAGMGGEFFAGGDFTRIGGMGTQRLARWDGSRWNAVGGGANGTVRALLRAPDGSLLVGGNFNRIGGRAILGLARWNGSTWTQLGSGVSGAVHALAFRGKDLLAAGGFHEAGGKTVNHVARWDGTEWHALGEGLSAGGYAAALALRGQDVFVAGSFATAGGVPTANVARWDGTRWLAIAANMSWPGRTLSARSLAVMGDSLFVGGDFAEVDGVATPGVAQWRNGVWSGVGSGTGRTDSELRVNALTARGKQLTLGGSFVGAGNRLLNRLAVWELTNEPPQVALTAPTNGATIHLDEPITLTATAADADGGLAKVEFFADGTLIGTVASAPYLQSWAAPLAGTFLLTARATDLQGESTWSAPVSVTLLPPADNQLPVVNIVSPTAGSVRTLGQPFPVEITATDPDGSVIEVKLFDGARLIGRSETAPFLFSVSDLQRGPQTLVAEATDNFGATTRSGPVAVRINTPPEVSVVGPREGEEYPLGQRIILDADARDFEGTIARVDFYTNGVFFLTAPQFSSPNATYRWENAPAGQYSLTAVGYDEDGAATTSGAVNFSVRVANQLPSVTLLAPGAGSTFGAPTNLVLLAEASDADGQIRSVEFYHYDQLLGAVTNRPYAFVFRNVTATEYGFRVRATDDRGGSSWTDPTLVTVTNDVARRPKYVLTDLGNLGGSASRARGLNNLGWVVGSAEVASRSEHSFLFTNGVMADLNPQFPIIGFQSEALSINDRGQFVGFSSSDSQHGYFAELGGAAQFKIAPPDTRRSFPFHINRDGQVVGRMEDFSGRTLGFVLRDGTFTTIAPATGDAEAYASNDDGVVVGRSASPAGVRALRWTATGSAELLGTLGGNFSEARDINASGLIVGSSYNALDQLRGVMFLNGFIVDLGTFGGAVSRATGVNRHGQIIGDSQNQFSEQRAFLWHGCVLYDLAELAGAPNGWTLSTATDINDRGQIVGYGYKGFDRNDTHAFLLTPAADSPVKPEDNVLLGVRADSFCACLPVAAGRPFVIESSPDLRFWTPVSTNYNRDGLLNFTDPNLGNNGQRFYRFTPLPE